MKLNKTNLVKCLKANGMMTREAIEVYFSINTKMEKLLSNFTNIICELRTEKKLKEDTLWLNGEELFGVK